MFGLQWYDYLFFPWTVSKGLWNQIRGQKKPDPGRVPQQSSYGYALPLVYGRTRITGKVIFWQDVAALTEGNLYPLTKIALALCEGPIAGVGRVWRDKDSKATPGEFGWTILTGSRPTQTAWSGFPSGKDLGYPGIALAAVKTMQIVSGQMGQSSFEVQGKLDATGDATNGDAHPADILKGSVATPASSMLCEPNFGAGFPFTVEVELGRDGTAASSYRRYTTAAGLWISPAFTEQRPATEHLQEILESTNASCLWTSGLLEIIPLGDQTVTGNSVTYTPSVTIQYALTKDDFLAQNDGSLLSVELAPANDVPNATWVEFLERAPTVASSDPANAYNASIATDNDPVDVFEVRGRRDAPKIELHSICQRPVAQTIARIRAQRSAQARNRYRFRLPWRFARLEPLDFVTLTDSLLGLNAVPVRIESIEEDPDTYELEVEAVEWPFGTGNAIPHTTQSSDGGTSIDSTTAEIRIHEVAARNWLAVTIPNSLWTAVTWNGSIFCAVGDSTACATSLDGLIWTTRTIPAGNWKAVVWNGTIFCAVGTNVCATSSDGITWTSRTIPAGSYQGLRWNGSIFCAVGTGSACATSSDGITWTGRTISAGDWFAVTWNGSIFVAVGSSSGTNICASSPDAITWTARRATDGTTSLTAIEWNNILFAATGISGGNPACLTSLDGITWTVQTVPTASAVGQIRGLAWTGRIFIGLLDATTTNGAALTSRDGVTWQISPTRMPHSGYRAVTWSGRMGCAVGQPGSTGVAAVSLVL